MVNYNLFKTLTEVELLSLRQTAINAILANGGKEVSSVGTRDLNVSFFNGGGGSTMTNTELAEGCLWGLQRINPKVYGNSLLTRKRKFVV